MKGETTAPATGVGTRGLSALGAEVRRFDRERYLAALFAPAAKREALFVLYAFNYEVARVREIVSQPMLGQIRLQWWREVIEAAFAGVPPRRHEVASPLAAVIREYALTRAHFDRLVDARERDLADEPPPTLAALENYGEATSASLMLLALEILGVQGGAAVTAAREVGVAYALTGLLRAMRFHARAHRSYIPADVASAAGCDPGDYAALRPTAGISRAAATIGAAAAERLAAVRGMRLPRGALPALLPAVAAGRALRQLRRAGNDPFDPRIAAPDGLLSWRYAMAMLRGRL